jgi:hypothetical protein
MIIAGEIRYLAQRWRLGKVTLNHGQMLCENWVLLVYTERWDAAKLYQKNSLEIR